MPSRAKKQLATSDLPVEGSPYRMGNWTVTMLKDELRNRQLPISGNKAELIDRLENSPVKSVVPRSPLKGLVEDMQLRLLEKKTESPLKSAAETPIKSFSSPLKQVENSPSRGRSRSPSVSQGMMTRSRSNSLTRGTFLTWTRQPLAVLGNFVMAQAEIVKENFLFFSALIGLIVSISVLVYLNENYRAILFDQFARVQPILQVFVDGFLSNLGLSRSEFSQYVSKASRFMYDCSSGNIERNSATGRLRCSAAPLKTADGGLAGRLFWLTREQFLVWAAGSLIASLTVFLVSRKARTALPIQTNQKMRKCLNLAVRLVFLVAALSPVEAVGLISGFAGFEGTKFAVLLALKAFFALPLQFACKVLIAKHQKLISAQLERLPVIISQFSFESVPLSLIRQILNAVLYTFICAAAIQVIANSRVYKNYRN